MFSLSTPSLFIIRNPSVDSRGKWQIGRKWEWKLDEAKACTCFWAFTHLITSETISWEFPLRGRETWSVCTCARERHQIKRIWYSLFAWQAHSSEARPSHMHCSLFQCLSSVAQKLLQFQTLVSILLFAPSSSLHVGVNTPHLTSYLQSDVDTMPCWKMQAFLSQI